MDNDDKKQAGIRLMTELAKGEQSGMEKGWFSIDEVEKNLELKNDGISYNIIEGAIDEP